MVNNNLSIEQTNRALARKRAKTKAGKIIANVFIYFVLLLMYAPLIYITIFSFTPNRVTGAWSGFSFANYSNLFSSNSDSKEIWRAAGNTVLVAFTSAIISCILGTLGAIGIYYSRKKWMKNTLDFVTQIPIVNAEIVTAVSLCVLFVLTAKFLPRSFAGESMMPLSPTASMMR